MRAWYTLTIVAVLAASSAWGEQQDGPKKNDADANQALTPTKVRLTFKNRGVVDAVADLAKRSGYTIEIKGDKAAFRNRRVTLDTGETTFWQAFDQLCQKADLVEADANPFGVQPGLPGAPGALPPPLPVNPVAVPPNNNKPPAAPAPNPAALPNVNPAQGAPGFPGAPGAAPSAQILLEDGIYKPVPTHYAGALRIRVLPASNARVASAKQPKQTAVALEIRGEPKLKWQQARIVQIDRALDDMGQKLEQVKELGVPGGLLPALPGAAPPAPPLPPPAVPADPNKLPPAPGAPPPAPANPKDQPKPPAPAPGAPAPVPAKDQPKAPAPAPGAPAPAPINPAAPAPANPQAPGVAPPAQAAPNAFPGAAPGAFPGMPGAMDSDKQVLMLRFQLGDKPSQSLKELKGVISGMTQKEVPQITVNDILKMTGKTIKGEKGGSILVREAVKETGRYRLRVVVEAPPEANPFGGIGLPAPGAPPIAPPPIVPQPNAVPPNAVPAIPGAQQPATKPVGSLALLDAEGQKLTQSLITTRVVGNLVEYTLLFRQGKDQGEAVKLVYSGPGWVTIEVPFTLKDVELP